MVRFLTILLSVIVSGELLSQQTNFDWAEQCGNPPNTTDAKTCLASGPGGHFTMAGEFINSAAFGDEILNAVGGTDVFIVQYNASGDVISALRMGAADYDFVQDVSMDGNGNTYVLGYFYGTTQIGSEQYTSYGSQDVFIARIDDAGKVNWSERIGGIMADYPTGIAVDADGYIYVTGYFYDSIAIGDTTLASQAGSDIYLARFSPDVELVNVFQAGGSSSDQVRSISIDHQGYLVITGSFYDDITLADTTLTTTDPVGIFLAKLDTSLEPVWALQLDGSYLNIEAYAETDHEGNIYLGGNFSEDIYFGSATFSAGEFNQDVYLAKYDGAGILQWARHGHSYASDQVVGLGVDENNNVYVSGHFLDTLHFDQLTLPYTLCCGSREVFIVNYTTDGLPWWGEQVSGARTALHDMILNTDGQVMLSGQFTEEVFLGPITLTYFEGFLNYIACLTGDMYTSVNPPEIRKNFGLYPNPVTETVHLNVEGKIRKTEVLNLAGELVLISEMKDHRALDVSFLAPGTYFLRVYDENGGIMVKKFIIIR